MTRFLDEAGVVLTSSLGDLDHAFTSTMTASRSVSGET